MTRDATDSITAEDTEEYNGTTASAWEIEPLNPDNIKRLLSLVEMPKIPPESYFYYVVRAWSGERVKIATGVGLPKPTKKPEVNE